MSKEPSLDPGDRGGRRPRRRSAARSQPHHIMPLASLKLTNNLSPTSNHLAASRTLPILLSRVAYPLLCFIWTTPF